MRSRLPPALALALAVLLLPACIAPPRPAPVQALLLDTLPASVPQAPPGVHALLVRRPEARPLLDTQRMAYRDAAHQVGHFGLHRWAETPAQMLQPLLVRTLERTGHFPAVLQAPAAAPARYVLRTELQELLQDHSVSPPVLRLALHMQLSDAGAGRVLVTREITRTRPLRQPTPVAGVAAANEALADALADLAGAVLAATP